jgi:uncharacterized membrane protein YoaK (UPF0700 family)
MLVREGDERSQTVDLWLACSLAAVAGALNAAAFYAVGFFSANMTGNVSTLSDHLALRQWTTAVFYFAILIAFVGGAACSATAIDVGRPRTRRIYAYAIMVEALMLAGVGCADLGLVKDWRTPVVVLGLAFAMGFQNAVGTRISGARVRTTHISGLATDIGIELAAAFDSLRRRRVEKERPHDFASLRLQVCTVLSFLTGGVGGVVLYRAIGGYLMILAAIALFGIAASAIARSRHYDLQTVAVGGD